MSETTASRRRTLRSGTILATAFLAALATWSAPVRADAADALRAFVRDVQSGRGVFTQTVVSPDGQRRKTSSGRFEFLRPDRFRFTYTQPFEQLIVADGRKVWLHDPDLNQASSRPMSAALGATPAAILTGRSLDDAFALTVEPSRDGLDWVLARPRKVDTTVDTLRVGFRGRQLAAIEIVDGFGQRSILRFTDFQPDVALNAAQFRFTPPPGTDVIEQ
jgi:outer membrane lipoprotein carrier protein